MSKGRTCGECLEFDIELYEKTRMPICMWHECEVDLKDTQYCPNFVENPDEVKRQGGILESWYPVVVTKGTIIYGRIYGDSNWRSGSVLRTSLVTNLNKMTVETRNTIYRLGKRYEAIR